MGNSASSADAAVAAAVTVAAVAASRKTQIASDVVTLLCYAARRVGHTLSADDCMRVLGFCRSSRRDSGGHLLITLFWSSCGPHLIRSRGSGHAETAAIREDCVRLTDGWAMRILRGKQWPSDDLVLVHSDGTEVRNCRDVARLTSVAWQGDTKPPSVACLEAVKIASLCVVASASSPPTAAGRPWFAVSAPVVRQRRGSAQAAPKVPTFAPQRSWTDSRLQRPRASLPGGVETPPVVTAIEPNVLCFASDQDADWVFVIGSGFGGCHESSLRVFCGKSQDKQPARATGVRRYSDALLGFRVPPEATFPCHVVVQNAYGAARSPQRLHRAQHQPPSPAPRVVSAVALGHHPTGGAPPGSMVLVEGGDLVESMTLRVNGVDVTDWRVRPDAGAAQLLLRLPGGRPREGAGTLVPVVAARGDGSAAASPQAVLAVSAPPSPTRRRRRSSIRVPQTPVEPVQHGEASEVWAVLGDSVQCLGVTMPAMVRTFRKLRVIHDLVSQGMLGDLREEDRLGYEDMRVLLRTQEMDSQYFFFRQRPDTAGTVPLFRALARRVWQQATAAGLQDIVLQGYSEGDVIFYDLDARKRLGDLELHDWWSTSFYDLQRSYDQFSHSGFYVRDPRRISASAPAPAIFHGLRSRVKELGTLACFCYMPKREVDFAKVFSKYSIVAPQIQRDAWRWYRAAIHRSARDGHRIVNDTADLWDIIGLLSSVRTSVPDSAEHAWKVTRVRAGEVRARSEEEAGPSKVMCSGFTASVLQEIFLEVAEKIRREGEALLASTPGDPGAEAACSVKVFPHLLMDTLEFTPQDLHRWDIWRDRPQRPEGLRQVADAEVVSNLDLLPSLQPCSSPVGRS
eukprot:TRINITY_DN10576_c0_g1_i1.p1 TRINITY_DN10576_c0_g1~~TRINITY_DN10576_c0_g1_i1.p1  ORF type:complete len:852 (+),score=192.17 TRINITY_DN10576_c0_g1_i1:76-2631(+)